MCHRKTDDCAVIQPYSVACISVWCICMLAGKRVVEVRETEIVLCDRKTDECEVLEYGTAVWSTGIGTRPVLANFMAKVGQADRRAVGTDEWLRVQGTRDVWAIGDCSTVVQVCLISYVHG